MIDQCTFDEFNFYLSGIENEKIKLSELQIEQEQLFSELKNISWQQLRVEAKPRDGSNTISFTVTFEQAFLDRIGKLHKSYSQLKHLSDVGEDNLFKSSNYATSCQIQLCAFSNRIDMSGCGIARSFRQLGLGCKIYRAMLEHADFLSSEDRNLSGYGKLIWNSMKNSNLFYTFYTSEKAFCFSADKKGEEILAILERNIDPVFIHALLWDKDFLKKFTPLIRESKLASLHSSHIG
jgi:hypothetical protein